MLSDICEPDTVKLTASPVINCKEFRNEVLAKVPADDPDPKQKTIDRVMEILEEMHVANEAKQFGALRGVPAGKGGEQRSASQGKAFPLKKAGKK